MGRKDLLFLGVAEVSSGVSEDVSVCGSVVL